MGKSIDLVGPADKVKATSFPIIDLSVAPKIDFGRLQEDLNALQSHVLPIVNWDLPAVLAGPIVRRAEPNAVYIWIATSVSATIELVVFLTPGTPLARGTATTKPFGANVHMALVAVKPASPFPRDVILSYTMTITALAGAFVGDVAFHETEIAYPPAKYPGSVLPSDQAPIVLLQGSCRKIHGPGGDAIAQGDAYLAGTAAQPARRPQQLLFTGDQVYADDVADGVLLLAQKLGTYLIGFDEMMPLGKPTPASTIAGGKGAANRGGLVRAAGFTSDEDSCANHMMAFSDFMTLYLLAWSGDVWALASSQYAKMVMGGRLDLVNLSPRAAQRLMANVPTYMMCDDHEVTDDWFIDSAFYANATTNPLLRRILLNAVGNYCIFQAWGNRPAEFEPRVDSVSAHVMRNAPADRAAADLTDTFIRHVWFFVTPTPAAVVMLDTRTRRVLRTAPNGPGLLNQGGLDDLKTALAASPQGHPVIIVSPPPVFGYEGLEFLQDMDVAMRSSKFYEDDFETWAANPDTFFKFLRTIADSGRRQVVFFAGDVHYAFANSVAYCLPPLHGVEVLHLTSSSLKNKMSTWQSRKALIPQALTTTEAKTFGMLKGDQYGSAELNQLLQADPYGIALGLVDGSANVYINWFFHDMGSGELVKDNNIGVFTYVPNAANPQDASVTNVYIDENGGRHTTSGSWRTLMARVQRSDRQGKWPK